MDTYLLFLIISYLSLKLVWKVESDVNAFNAPLTFVIFASVQLKK